MELTNEFRVGVPVEEAWSVLTNVERIAPCLPGAQLEEVDGDEYRGVVKVKVGPITAQYKGKATFVQQDAATHTAVLRAEGRDTRGQGNANATVTATLHADGDGTAVKVVTDLTITGKVAQFGRGVLADVSGKLIGQFVDNLERDVLSASAPAPASSPASPAPVAPAPPAVAATTPASPPAATNGSTGPRRIESRAAEPVDLLATAGSSVAKRAVPALTLAGVLVLFLWRRARRHRR